MKKLGIIILAAMLVSFTFSGASAQPIIDLYDWAFNIDETTVASLTLSGGAGYYTPVAGDFDDLDGSIDVSAFDFSNGQGSGGGLGTISITVTGAGVHYVGAFFDHEIDETVTTYFNEYGSISGTPAAGQSWEIDEPGFVFGDIFDNFSDSTLDNSNGVPAGSRDDVSMALGWDFSLAAGETAVIDFILSETEPSSGFFLDQTDFYSNAIIYLSSNLNIYGGATPSIDEIIAEFDDYVDRGTVAGKGPAYSANTRLGSFANMLDEAQAYIDAEDFAAACDQLESIYGKCDGEPRPPDFIEGENADELAARIMELATALECSWVSP